MTVCEELPAPTVGYETVQDCDEDLSRHLSAGSRKFPIVVANCVPLDPLSEGDLEIVWDIDSEGQLVAEVHTFDDVIEQDAPLVAQLPIRGKGPRL
jgi:hypothetical protein